MAQNETKRKAEKIYHFKDFNEKGRSENFFEVDLDVKNIPNFHICKGDDILQILGNIRVLIDLRQVVAFSGIVMDHLANQRFCKPLKKKNRQINESTYTKEDSEKN